MTVSEKVRNYCSDHNITYREFGEIVGMTEFAVSRLIKYGRLPRVMYLRNIALLTGETLDELLKDEQ